MTSRFTGWIIFVAALGMMCGLLAIDVAKLTTWEEAAYPSFIAQVLAHFGTVSLAFVGGKLIPTQPRN